MEGLFDVVKFFMIYSQYKIVTFPTRRNLFIPQLDQDTISKSQNYMQRRILSM